MIRRRSTLERTCLFRIRWRLNEARTVVMGPPAAVAALVGKDILLHSTIEALPRLMMAKSLVIRSSSRSALSRRLGRDSARWMGDQASETAGSDTPPPLLYPADQESCRERSDGGSGQGYDLRGGKEDARGKHKVDKTAREVAQLTPNKVDADTRGGRSPSNLSPLIESSPEAMGRLSSPWVQSAYAIRPLSISAAPAVSVPVSQVVAWAVQ